MLKKAHIDRLDLAEQVLIGWEAMLARGELSPENAMLARNEVVNLQKYSSLDPERIGDLIARFQRIADSLSLRFN